MARCPRCEHDNPDTNQFCSQCGSALKEEKDPFVGITIDGRYEVVEEVAAGGMGVVYRANQVRLNKEVALKILHPQLALDKKFITRFENEAMVVAGLDHENIVRVLDTGPVSDTYFIAMDFVDGKNLLDIIKKDAPIEVEEAFDIVHQVAGGLAYAHEKEVIHRDIKPANIMVDDNGKAALTDFGIAKAAGASRLTTTGMAIGTPEYMSLEQVKGEELDGRTDVYSLGIVLYEMLTGVSPFRTDTGISTITKVVTEEAHPISKIVSDLPDEAIDIVNSAICKERDYRYQDAGEFAGDLKAFLDGDREAIRGRTPPQRPKEETRVVEVEEKKGPPPTEEKEEEGKIRPPIEKGMEVMRGIWDALTSFNKKVKEFKKKHPKWKKYLYRGAIILLLILSALFFINHFRNFDISGYERTSLISQFRNFDIDRYEPTFDFSGFPDFSLFILIVLLVLWFLVVTKPKEGFFIGGFFVQLYMLGIFIRNCSRHGFPKDEYIVLWILALLVPPFVVSFLGLLITSIISQFKKLLKNIMK